MAPLLRYSGAMDLRLYVENIHRQLAVAAEAGGDESRAVAESLVAPLDAALRLTLQDVLAAAAEEITTELAPGSVEVRLRGRDVELVVTPPPADHGFDASAGGIHDQVPTGQPGPAPAAPEPEDGSMTRINLRMSDQLKGRVEQAAASEGLSVNAWLVRAATAALDRTDPGRTSNNYRAARGSQRFTGWAR
jgi:predicted HicB family RNase H-like nuclease